MFAVYRARSCAHGWRGQRSHSSELNLRKTLYPGPETLSLPLQDEELRGRLQPWRTNVDLKDRWRSLVKAAQSGDPKRAGGHLGAEQARPDLLKLLSRCGF